MNTRLVRSVSLLLMLAANLFFAATRAVAQDDEDPPSRVARLGYINGQVSFNPAGTDDWVSAVVNRPITTGDKLWTDHGSRAELQIGSAAIRLSERTGFSFLNLSDRMMQIRLTEGTIGLRVRRLADDEAIEVDTPNLAFSILRPGRYRVNVNEAGDTTIINVTDGEGEVTGGGSSFSVHPGQQGIFTGTDSLGGDMEVLPDADSFDQWADQRDLREDHAVARRYVSDDVIGYEDLDDYGGWRPTPEYGTVWFPHVTVVGWAPYRYGHWAYIAPWGWTWVDDSAWGFAPFHYGRWISVGGAWGWVPCPPRVVAVAYVRPVYAPALVAWVGGPRFAVGIGVGGGFAAGVNVGWFPLGPREVFVPSYPVSRAYVNNINVSNTNVNTTVVNNYYNTTVVNKNVNNVHYVNQSVNGAVTATSPRAFTSAQPVGRNMVAVNPKEVAAAPVAASAPAVVPPKQAVLGSGAAASVRPPAASQSRAVVAKVAPPPAPLPFQQRQAAIQANQGRPLALAQARQLQVSHASTATNPAVAPVKIAPAASPATAKINAMPNNGAANNSRPVNSNPNQPPAINGSQPNTAVQPNRGLSPQATVNRPPSARPTAVENPRLEQRHQQQNEQLQQKQDQERQKLEQQQYQQQQKLQQQNANEQKQRQLQEQQQQKLQQLEQRHDQQGQVLKQRQETEHARPAPAKESKPAKEDKPKH